MASGTISDLVAERLGDCDAPRIFSYPGDGIHGLMGAFDRAGGRLKSIQVWHGAEVAFVACTHATYTGQSGV